jgi:hypothetical protein
LDLAAQMIEAEDVGFYNPGAWGHSVEPETPVLVGERDQASLALRRAHGHAGNRLTACLYGSRLLRNRLRKHQWQACCQKHENFGH